jgi:outer membrane protein
MSRITGETGDRRRPICLKTWGLCYPGPKLLALVFGLSLCSPVLGGSDFLVLGSYSNKESALAASRALAVKLQLELTLTTVQINERTLYRIVAGPYEAAGADSAREGASSAGISGAWILHEPVVQGQSTKPLSSEKIPPIQTVEEPVAHDAGVDTEAEITVNQKPTITLKQAVQIALEQNLGLLASEQGLLSGEAQVRQSRAGLMPQLTSGVMQTAIDKDRAEAGFGRAPQYRTSASLKLTQVIYADDVKAGYDIQRMLQSARISEQETVVLDTIFKASSSYLALLRTETLVRIFADDLQLTDSNYERAKVRLELGVANKAEVYRWETAQAKARKSLVLAKADVERAKINLNKVLNLPLDEDFLTIVPKVTDTYLLIANPVVWERLQNDMYRKEIREFWVAEALLFSPDLQALREKQAAQERSLLAAKRSLAIPIVGVAVEGTKHLSDRGAGTNQLDIEIPGSDLKFGGATDNVEWSAGVQASLPLSAGGERYARIAREQANLAQLQLAYDDALQSVQAKVLQSAASVQASLKNIEYSQDAAEASRNNLQLVTDSYERGVVTNIELLDAQFALLSSELSAANTVFDFILEYLTLQRVIGEFDLVATPEELTRVRGRMDGFFN